MDNTSWSLQHDDAGGDDDADDDDDDDDDGRNKFIINSQQGINMSNMMKACSKQSTDSSVPMAMRMVETTLSIQHPKDASILHVMTQRSCHQS